MKHLKVVLFYLLLFLYMGVHIQAVDTVGTWSHPEKIDQRVDLNLVGANLNSVVQSLAGKAELVIVTTSYLEGDIDVEVSDITLKDALILVLNTCQYSVDFKGDMLIISSQESFNSATKEVDTKGVSVQYMAKDQLKTIAENYLKEDEFIEIKDHMVFITAEKTRIKHLIKRLELLDSSITPQVVLNTHILEMSQNQIQDLNLALQNIDKKKHNNELFPEERFKKISQLMSKWSMKNNVVTLLSSDVKAVNAEYAELFVGKEVPYKSLEKVNNGETQNSYAYKQAGVHIKMKPDVNVFAQEIKVKIIPSISSVVGYNESNKKLPIMTTQTVTKTVVIPNNHTVLIQGLGIMPKQKKANHLKKIPWIGHWFEKPERKENLKQLVIALTPLIIE